MMKCNKIVNDIFFLAFLPTLYGNFVPLIDVPFPPLIRGLANDSEPVRDDAIRAGDVLSNRKMYIHMVI